MTCASCDSATAEEMSESTENGTGPCAATFSRARLCVDAMLMMSRRNFWRQNGYDNFFVSLGVLAADIDRSVIELVGGGGHAGGFLRSP